MTPEIPIEAFEIFVNGLDHPECLAFDRHGDVWAGGEAGQIYRIGPDRHVTTVANLGGFCAGLAFSPIGELFVCNPARGIVRVEPNGEFSVFATHAGGHQLICPNFGVFDRAGYYYVTDSGNWKKNNGCLIRFRPDGSGEVLAGPMGYANGLALTPAGDVLYMVESNTERVLRFAIDVDGSVGAPIVFAEECGRFPDGLVLDAAGNLYVCCYASDEIWQITPSGGKKLLAWDRFGIHLGSPTNMAFGGPDFDELYVANLGRTTITRAKIGRKGQLLAHQQAGQKLKARPVAL